jgi:tight adherence protein C
MTATALAGALVGLGVWGLVRALHPARPSLAEALASLRPVTVAQPIVTPAEATWGPIARLGAPIVRLLDRSLRSPTSLLSARVHCDLLVVQRSAHRHLAEKLATALIGFLTPTLAASLLTAAGAPIPFALPAVASVALGVAGFFLPDGAVRSEAEKRRDEFREALSVFIDLTSLGLAAGSGPEEAMAEAARIGRGWSFAQLRRALEVTAYSRETSWTALTRLGQELGVPELEEVASSIGLAEEKGARVRESLAERATSMRRARLAEAEGKARRASQRMSLPVVLLLVGFIVFIAYPAIERIVSVGQ